MFQVRPFGLLVPWVFTRCRQAARSSLLARTTGSHAPSPEEKAIWGMFTLLTHYGTRAHGAFEKIIKADYTINWRKARFVEIEKAWHHVTSMFPDIITLDSWIQASGNVWWCWLSLRIPGSVTVNTVIIPLEWRTFQKWVITLSLNTNVTDRHVLVSVRDV